jgi:hypothetical protein
MHATLRPVELPRGLIFLGSLWLIGSWLLSIGVRTPIQPVSANYTPGVRTMLLCLAVGLLVAWPLLRLSQPPRTSPIGQTMLDLVSLIALVQVVVWPLRLVTPWPLSRTAAMDATLTGWLLLAGAIVASACGAARAGPRCLAMAACVSLCVLGPALTWIGVAGRLDLTGLLEVSPLTAMHDLSGGGGAPATVSEWSRVVVTWAAAVLAWAALLATRPFARRDPVRADPAS